MQKNFYDNNTQPFYDVTYIKDGTVYVDIDRLLSLKTEDMYEWFYEVADMARTNSNMTYPKLPSKLLIKGGALYRRASDYRNMLLVPIV